MIFVDYVKYVYLCLRIFVCVVGGMVYIWYSKCICICVWYLLEDWKLYIWKNKVWVRKICLGLKSLGYSLENNENKSWYKKIIENLYSEV